MVDRLQDGCPGCDTDTRTDEHSDFVFEDILSGSAIGSINAECWHPLAVLQCDFIHAHGIELIVHLGLRLSGTKRISESASEVTDLTDVDGNIRVVRARSDGERMPLVVANFRAVQEQPLSRLVLHARLSELNLNGIYSELVVIVVKALSKLTIWMSDDLDDLCLPSATNLTVETIGKIQAATDKFPTPSLVSNAVFPEVVMIERRERLGSVTDEAVGGVRVHSKEEWNEQVMSIPECLE